MTAPRMALNEREAYELLGFLLACGETSTSDPHYYSSLRLVEAASRVMDFMLGHSHNDNEWLIEFKQRVDRGKWLLRDQEAYHGFRRDITAEIAGELKRRYLGS